MSDIECSLNRTAKIVIGPDSRSCQFSGSESLGGGGETIENRDTSILKFGNVMPD